MTGASDLLTYGIEAVYLTAVLLFIVALQRMSNPATARSGILWAGLGMLVAIIVTGFDPKILSTGPTLTTNLILMGLAISIGGGIAYYAAINVKMTAMPQMVAVYNGMGGGAAAGIAAVAALAHTFSPGYLTLALVGGLIGAVSFSGSLIAFLKLQGWLEQKPIVWPAQRAMNLWVLVLAMAFGGIFLAAPDSLSNMPFLSFLGPLGLFFLLSLSYGFLMTLPIGGADMPVVISLYNAFTGIAVGLDGFAVGNYAMIVAGILVGAAGSLLTLLMAKAMNRSLGNVLFSAFGATEEAGGEVTGSLKPIEAPDVAAMMAYAGEVIIVPGYGMAVAQAQHKVKEMADLLEKKGVTVKFAIHPVAGRMPGHMNVLLAEAGVPYNRLFDRDEINAEFPSADVALVIGANDVVNPAARREGSPLFGMPILDVDRVKNVVVLKRGKGKGFSGLENDLFYKENTRMLYGDAQESVNQLVQELKQL